MKTLGLDPDKTYSQADLNMAKIKKLKGKVLHQVYNFLIEIQRLTQTQAVMRKISLQFKKPMNRYSKLGPIAGRALSNKGRTHVDRIPTDQNGRKKSR